VTIKSLLRTTLLNGPLKWLGVCFRPVPPRIISSTLVNILRLLAISRPPKEGLNLLLTVEKALYGLTGEQACRYGDGVHTKHRHIGYHEFFCNRLKPGERVLDIGCGNGSLAYDMAEKAGAVVTGIELSEKNYRQAVERFSHPKVTYIHGDVLRKLPGTTFDTVVMSNVLEHLEDRIGFLRLVQDRISPRCWLLRVPTYERDWRVPLMEEIGIDYRLDSSHYIEYTQETFIEELAAAGLEVVHMEIRWGEIWSEARDTRE
jgi:2-polyprenyl-3-methyl-5-hydroxy-6-metoxy-1,4-benzoquinol methylase